MEAGIIIFYLILVVVTIVVMRLVGAWMLRINEIISWQAQNWTQMNEILEELKKINRQNESNSK